jgi:molybdopterin molybdotransferase
MLSVTDACALVLARVAALPSIGTERVALQAARARVLAGELVAARPLPGFDNAAMDGYAVRVADVPGTLPIATAVAAGATRVQPLPAGTAARILTGAPMPPGADAVVIQEDAQVVGERVTLPAATRGDNVRRTGEDVAVGEVAVPRGVRIGVGEVGVLAALGVGEVGVGRSPRVAVIATGDELVEVSVAPQPGQLVDSSAYALAAAIADAGGTVVRREIVRDDGHVIAAVIAAALRDCDAVVTTGGVSVGDRDFVRGALAAAGCTLEAWKVAMRPGKPFAFGHDGRRPVFGLPGNPVSAVVAFELFVRPALLAMQGAAVVARPRVDVALAGGYRKTTGRAHYLRARVAREDGRLVARLHPKQGSAMLSSLVGCNALVEVGSDVTAVGDGDVLPALLLEAV